MNDRAFAALFVLATWWLSTIVVLRAVWLERSTHRWSGAVASVVGVAGLFGVFWSARVESKPAAYVSFGSALAVWGWHELSFLLGLVTGPRKLPCPPDATGWRRFAYATSAVIHHEVALALTMMLVATLTWGQPNQLGTQTFLVLWVMRLSAKLNVFLGVRNLTEQFVPAHLRYLRTYFRRARLNPLMPVSLLAGTIVVARLGRDALASGGTELFVVERVLVTSILALAVLEHVFLTLPVPDAVLWSWATRTRRGRQASTTEPLTDLTVEAP